MKSRFVYQEDVSDCGLACIAMIAASHNQSYDLAALKREFTTSAVGSSLAELLAIASHLGFQTRAVRVGIDALNTLKQPTLLHWGFNHYVVLVCIKRNKFTIYDPAIGRRTLAKSEVFRVFTGVAVEFDKRQNLKKLETSAELSLWDLMVSAPNAGRRLSLCLLLSVLALFGIALFPLYIRAIIEFAVAPRNFVSLYIIVAFTCFFTIILSVFSYFKYVVIRGLSQDIDYCLAQFLNNLVFRTSFDFFMRKTPGMIARYFQNLRRVRLIISEGVVEALVDFVAVFVITGVTFFIDLKLGMALCVTILLYLALVIAAQWNRTERFKQSARIENQENLILMDNLRNIQAIKLNGLEAVRSELWQVAYRRAASSLDQLNHLSVKAELVGGGFLAVARCAMVGIAGYFVLVSGATYPEFLSFALYQAFVTLSLTNLLRRLIGLWDIQSILSDMGSLLVAERDPLIPKLSINTEDLDDEIDPDLKAASVVVIGKPVFECRELSFRFDQLSPRLFRNTTFHADHGEIIAITGASGCGKSTLLRVINGLLKKESGQIDWVGRPLELWQRSELVRHVASVMQEDQIFTGTLLQNISHFSSDPDMDHVQTVCEQSGISEFVHHLPMGLYTPLASNSTVLSQGEKQRVFLGRALYLNSNTLILDEFTGNLDQDTENVIFSNLRDQNKTIIMSAHRASTIKQADKILEFEPNCREFLLTSPGSVSERQSG